jgi:hypothetical protein
MHLFGLYYTFFLYFVLWEACILQIEEAYCSDMWYTPTSLTELRVEYDLDISVESNCQEHVSEGRTASLM